MGVYKIGRREEGVGCRGGRDAERTDVFVDLVLYIYGFTVLDPADKYNYYEEKSEKQIGKRVTIHIPSILFVI